MNEYVYIFTVTCTSSGPVCCRFYDVTSMLGHTYTSFIDAQHKRMEVTKRLGVKATDLKDLPEMLAPLVFRGRFCDGGPCLVKTETPMDADSMSALLTHKQQRGELEAFLETARWR